MSGHKKKVGFLTTLRVGFFLALRQIRRTSKWTNILVICVMVLTFLNLVVVSGILVGLIEGATRAIQTRYLGNVFITNLREKNYIERSSDIVALARNLPGVTAVSGRYIEGGTVEAHYKEAKKRPTDKSQAVGASIAGIDPVAENAFAGLADLIVEGRYLSPGDYDQVIVGAMLLDRYLGFDSPSFPTLRNLQIGDKIRIVVNGNTREVWVKGIIRSKVDELDRRIFFVDSQLRGLIGRGDYNVDEIAIRTRPGVDPFTVKAALLANHFDDYATIQAGDEGEPKFIKDIKQTFNMLGTAISSIGLVVASITIFIVIFINAITRRKFIGILQGIGISSRAIEVAYVFQAMLYAVIGALIGSLIVFGFLKPYIDVHPINFPFSDGILVVPIFDTSIRVITLFIATLIAGYIPVKLITRQNTLDAILNR